MSKTNFFFTALIFSIVSLSSFNFDIPANNGLTQDVLKYTNDFRRSKKLKPLEMRNDLNAIARKHSEEMASGRRSFGHAGLHQREVQVKKIIKASCGIAENVAYGASNGKEAFNIWKNSVGHRKNMLGDYKYIGIGTASNKKGVIYYTQIFVK